MRPDLSRTFQAAASRGADRQARRFQPLYTPLMRSWSIMLALLPALACANSSAKEQADAESSSAEAEEPAATLLQAAATITAADLRARVSILANDSLRGRSTPSPGLEAAASYLAREFERLKLQPRGDPGSYLQRYPLEFAAARPPNVVAVIEGADSVLRDTYVVFSAHLDHVGVGPPDARGDSIYNGADDDASGTAAVMELAEAFASLPEPPRRSLMFLAVSGEEQNLLGSRYFSEHPPVPISALVANINIDMISRNARDTVVGIGQEYSSLGQETQRVVRAHPELGLTVAPDLWPTERLFFRSDHFNFVRKHVPSIFFFAGLHEDYHRPSDHVEKIDADKAARVTRLIFFLGAALADAQQAPYWTADGLRMVQSLR